MAQTFTPRGHGAAHPPTSLGLDMRKVGMWTFLGSESLFFATLITNFFINRSSEHKDYCDGLTQADLAIGLTGIGAFILLMSSLTMVLALAALRDGNRRMYRTWILSTALLGASFLCIQIYEFTEFALHGKGMSSNMFGASFFALTGFHGTHVLIGVIWLSSLLFLRVGDNVRRPLEYVVGGQAGLRSHRAPSDGGAGIPVELCGLYWHFVDLIWVFIFTLIYLLPMDNPCHEAAEAALAVGRLTVL